MLINLFIEGKRQTLAGFSLSTVMIQCFLCFLTGTQTQSFLNWIFFDRYPQPKDCCRLSTRLHTGSTLQKDNTTHKELMEHDKELTWSPDSLCLWSSQASLIHKGHTPQPTGPKGSWCHTSDYRWTRDRCNGHVHKKVDQNANNQINYN